MDKPSHGGTTVSVVIPLFNKAPFVGRCLRSVLGQSYADLDVVIVDDGSTDDGAAVVKSFSDPRIRLLEQQNRGEGAARNAGLEVASGEMIAFLDADDEWRPDHIETLTSIMAHNPHVVAACAEYRQEAESYSRSLISLPSSRRLEPYRLHDVVSFDYLEALTSNIFPASCSSTIIRAALVRDKNLRFAVGMRRGADLNFWVQCSAHGCFVYTESQSAIYHRDDPESEMSRTMRIGEPTPDLFAGLPAEYLERHPMGRIRRFVLREYLKNAYRNRGAEFRFEEIKAPRFGLSPMLLAIPYLLVRFMPRWLLVRAKLVLNLS